MKVYFDSFLSILIVIALAPIAIKSWGGVFNNEENQSEIHLLNKQITELENKIDQNFSAQNKLIKTTSKHLASIKEGETNLNEAIDLLEKQNNDGVQATDSLRKSLNNLVEKIKVYRSVCKEALINFESL